MILTIEEKKENYFMSRREIKAIAEFERATPSNGSIVELLSKETKTSADVITIKTIKTLFGQKKAKIEAYIYDTTERRQKFESLTPQQKKNLAEEKKKAAAPTAGA